MAPLRAALDRGLLSIRGVDRTLRVAWTLCRPRRPEFAGAGRSHCGAELPASRGCAMTDDVRRAWAYLSRVAEPPCPELSALAARVGPVEAAELVRLGKVDDALARRTEARRGIDSAAKDLEVLARMGGRLITADDDEWPLLCLRGVRWCRHPAEAAGASADGAVGGGSGAAGRAWPIEPRRSSAPGRPRRTASMSQRTWPPDWPGVTWPWCRAGRTASTEPRTARRWPATGSPSRCWPAASMFPTRPGIPRCCTGSRENGLLVSEYPPGVRPARHRFLTRNRLVAALAGATVVVEAGVRSGAANTAAWARALGRVVCAVPGPVTSSASAGCHALLRHGAELVTRAEDIVELVGHAGELAPDEQRPTISARRFGRHRAAGLRRVAGPRRTHRRRDRGRIRPASHAGVGSVGHAGGLRSGGLPGRPLETRPPLAATKRRPPSYSR